ncbi:GNAT family N-acetyltransferase [Microbacterium gorillae]|uniref:GNAT family N-acetyltransferase n=1 Tax=Microbacterium gorillae TaxID=1231063 RepID=UPI00058BF298|nr:GNAT family N-acetyltransferase [Microbacterium gorillae]
MTSISVSPVTADRFDDLQHTLTGGGDGASCQCQWWLMTQREFSGSSRADKEELLRAETARSPVPGLVAYVDGVAAGWVRVGPRPAQPRIGRTRIVAAGSSEPADATDVWAITCFSVRRDHRRLGLTETLATAAVAFAQENGARVVEAYPVDTAEVQRSVNELFLGTVAMFQRAGFAVAARPKTGRAVMSLSLPRVGESSS